MTEIVHEPTGEMMQAVHPSRAKGGAHLSSAQWQARLRKRYAAEARFKYYGIASIAIALGMLAVLLVSIVAKGWPAFTQTMITLDVPLVEGVIDPVGDRNEAIMRAADYQGLVNAVLYARFPDVEDRKERKALRGLVSPGAGFELRNKVIADPDLIGTSVRITAPMTDMFDQLSKGLVDLDLPAQTRGLSDAEIGWYDALVEDGHIHRPINFSFFTAADSRRPELAGVLGAVIGSLYTLAVCLVLSFPIGIAAAIYLEEFAPKNKLTDLIEVNINNLAAVPSIVFGLLGLAVFIQVFGLPRSAPLVGGMVLALMTLPTIIIAARAALKAVPPSIREGALGIGASRQQAVMHHVLPLAMPGMLTGAIIGMAQALGETAPLLMIGMVAFITAAPTGVTDPSTVLPVQIYLWADSPERGFAAKTSAAIMVLLTFLICMNALAVILRKKFERRW